MDAARFEAICRASGCDILPKRMTPRGNILLAERMRYDPVRYPYPYVETWWAGERDTCDIAQFVRNDFAARKNGIARTITQADRIADALEAAEEWFACMDRGEERAKATHR